MNILLFVISILLILSFTSQTLLQSRIDTQYEELSYSGFMNAEREAYNEVAKSEFRSRKKPDEPHLKKQKKETSPKEFISKRDKIDVIDKEGSKFNLAPLMSEHKPEYFDAYYKIGLRFLEDLYGHAEFLKTTDLSKILDELIALGKNSGEEESFFIFSSEKSPYKKELYNLLLGTQEYDLKSKVGYPPLEHFFTMNRSVKKKPLNFKHLSSHLLRAIFGNALTEEIMEAEKKNWENKKQDYTLGLKELESLLSSHNSPQFDKKFVSILFGATGKADVKSTVRGEDPSSKIRCNKASNSGDLGQD